MVCIRVKFPGSKFIQLFIDKRNKTIYILAKIFFGKFSRINCFLTFILHNQLENASACIFSVQEQYFISIICDLKQKIDHSEKYYQAMN